MPAVILFHDNIRKAAKLWITTANADRSTLVHEIGHQLGLVVGPGHVQRDNPRHCTEPQCVMTQARLRSILYHAVPTFFTGRIPHGYCNKCRSDLREARRYWSEKMAREPDLADSLRQRREIERYREESDWHVQESEWDEALAKLERAEAMGGQEAARIGYVLQLADRLEESADAYARVRVMDRLAFKTRVHVLCVLGRYAEALELLDSETPEHVRFPELRARALGGLGRDVEAAAVWLDLLGTMNRRRYPQAFVELSATIAKIRRRAGDLDGAERIVREALTRAPRSPVLRLELGRTLLSAGRFDEARSTLKNLVGEKQARAQHEGEILTRALAAALLGDRDVATGAIAKLERDPEGRARILALLGAAEAALDTLELIPRVHLADDPCVAEDFASLRATERFRKRFPHCPQRRLLEHVENDVSR